MQEASKLNMLTSCWLASSIITYEWLLALEPAAGGPGYRSPVVTKIHWSSPSCSQTLLDMSNKEGGGRLAQRYVAQ